MLTQFPAEHPSSQRHRAGHRADRQRQIDHALRRAERNQLDGEQRLHGRRPDRIPPAADQSVPGAGTKVGLTFSKALRTLLRQDPDVIMVGEVRDEETARTAIQAALTGPPGVQHAAHQRRLLGDHAAGQHGGRAVPDRRGAEHGAGATAGAAHLSPSAGRSTSRRGISARPWSGWAASGPRFSRASAAATAATRASADVSASTNCCCWTMRFAMRSWPTVRWRRFAN